MVEANLLAASSSRADGQVVNVGAGTQTDLNTLARTILELTGSSSPVVHGPPRSGDVRDSLASLERAKELLGYAPRVTVHEGLDRTVEWFRHQARP